MYFDTEKKNNSDFDLDLTELIKESEKLEPRFNVILLDDNDHTYEYVIEMLMKVCGYTKKLSYEMACEVDFLGRVIIYTGDKKSAEEKRDGILSYGPDWRLERSIGPMKARLEILD